MTMRTCDACGTLVGDSWEHCLRCGEALTPLPPPPPGLRTRLAARLQRRDRRLLAPADLTGAMSATRNALSRAVPAWAFAPPAIAIIVLLVLLALLGTGRDDGAAEAARSAAVAETALVTEELREAEAERDRLAAEVAEAEDRLAALEDVAEGAAADLGELQEELAAAQAAAAEAEADLQASQEALRASESRIAALEECLDGTTVALAFARDGRQGAADVALAAVADACAAARG
jgi:hypothetical protein